MALNRLHKICKNMIKEEKIIYHFSLDQIRLAALSDE